MAAGSGDLAGVRRAGFTALGLGVVFMTGAALVFLLFARQIVGLYIDLGDPANARAVELAVRFLYVAAAFEIFDGTQVLMNMSLRGIKDVHVPMWLAGISYWLTGLPLAILFGFVMGMEGVGIWLALAGSLLVAATLMTLRFAYLSGTLALLSPKRS
jgi:MATE family multidrug resistance protein